MNMKRGLALMVYKFFDKESTSFVQKPAAGGGLNELVDELHKPIITKFKIFKIYSSFKGNICGTNLVDMQLISRYNKEIRFLLCIIDCSY